MKLIVGIIRPEQLAAVQRALYGRDIDQMTVCSVHGSGHERGPSLIYRGAAVEEKMISRCKLEVVVEDWQADAAVAAIQAAAQTGQVGDGMIWVTNLEQTVRIRTARRTLCQPERKLATFVN